jgi:hypothetical protein
MLSPPGLPKGNKGQNSSRNIDEDRDDARDLFGELEESIATLPQTLGET